MDRTPRNNACAIADECRSPSRKYVAAHNWPARCRASRRSQLRDDESCAVLDSLLSMKTQCSSRKAGFPAEYNEQAPPKVRPRGSLRTALVPPRSRYGHGGRHKRGSPPAAGARFVIPARRERNASALGAATVRSVLFAERRHPPPKG